MKHRMTKAGQLSREDIIREMKANNLVIEPHINPNDKDSSIKAASLDITPSCLIMSVKTGKFMKIYTSISRCAKGHRNPEWHCSSCHKNQQKNAKCPEQRFVYIEPRDTALVLSKEYLQLPENICGNVFSRVSTVSSGLGHISTTIDPLWRGALLIAISNPSSEPIKLMIQDETAESVPLATVVLQYLNTPVNKSTIHNTHLPARVDVLEKYLYDVAETKSRWVFLKKAVSRFIYAKDYNLTSRLIDQLRRLANVKPEMWNGELEKLEEQVCAQKVRGKMWRNNLRRVGSWLVKILLITGLLTIVASLSMMCIGDSTESVLFISSMIVGVVECLVASILGFK